MTDFSLEDLKRSADKKYRSMDISTPDGRTLRLLNVLRLDENKRRELEEFQSELRNLDEDERSVDETLRVVRKTLGLVVRPEDSDALFHLIGDDRALLLTVFETWQEQTQAGEAESSQA